MVKTLERYLSARQQLIDEHTESAKKDVPVTPAVEEAGRAAVDAALTNILVGAGVNDPHGKDHLQETIHRFFQQRAGGQQTEQGSAADLRQTPDATQTNSTSSEHSVNSNNLNSTRTLS